MANQLFPKAKEDFLGGNLNLSSNTIVIALIDTDVYTFNVSHEDRADVPNTAIIGAENLSGKSITSGVFNASDVTFSSLTGANTEAILIYHDTGDQTTSRLIAYIDVASGLPITPNGSDVTVNFSDGANKIFAL